MSNIKGRIVLSKLKGNKWQLSALTMEPDGIIHIIAAKMFVAKEG